jgi:hypothetical protein
MVLPDARHCLADCPGNAGSSPLGGGPTSSIAPTEAECAGQLADNEVTLGFRLRGARAITDHSRFFDILFDLGETPAVRLFGSLIEHRAPVGQRRARPICRWHARVTLEGDQIQRVELAPGLGQQSPEVTHALEVPHADCSSIERHRPIVSLAAKDVGATRGCDPSFAVSDGAASRSLHWMYDSDSFEGSLDGLEFYAGSLIVSLGAVCLGETLSGQRHFVGGSHFIPLPRRELEIASRLRCISLGQ